MGLKQSKEIMCESTLLRKTNSSIGRTLSYDEQWSSDEQSPSSWWKEFWLMACADESSFGFSRCVWDCHERVSRTQCQCYWGTTIYLQRFEETSDTIKRGALHCSAFFNSLLLLNKRVIPLGLKWLMIISTINDFLPNDHFLSRTTFHCN